MTYFAAALARTERGWTGTELDLDDVEDIEAVTDVLRDLSGDGDGPALLLLEENDEYLAVVRVDGGSGGLGEARVFLSDRRAVEGSDIAAMLWEQAETPAPAEDDEEEGARPMAEPVGDADLLSDLGTSSQELLGLCAAKGMLPADVLSEICERAGCSEALESLREG